MVSNKTNVTIKTSQDGQTVILEITGPKRGTVTLELPAHNVGLFAVGLLNAAIACAQKTKPTANPFERERSQETPIYAQARGVALRDTDKPDVIGMVFAVGVTELNLGLSRAALQSLGTALLAETADPSKPQ